jgi:serine O-acetyltransferase
MQGYMNMIYRNEIQITKANLGVVNKFILLAYSRWYLKPFKKLVSLFLHVDLPRISKDCVIRMPHTYNITINSKVFIGGNLTIYHGVTIGSKQFGAKVGVPNIGVDVVIYPNSIIVGDISIGDGSIVGAGSIVTNDIPTNSIVSGNPAKVVAYIN